MTDIQKKLERKKTDFKRFDSLPLEERKRLTDQGLNPHEPEAVRNKKQELLHEEIKRDITRKTTGKMRSKLLSLIERGKHGKRISTDAMDAIHPEDQNDII